MKSTYVDTRSANVGDIRCLFALANDSTNCNISLCGLSTANIAPKCLKLLSGLPNYEALQNVNWHSCIQSVPAFNDA